MPSAPHLANHCGSQQHDDEESNGVSSSEEDEEDDEEEEEVADERRDHLADLPPPVQVCDVENIYMYKYVRAVNSRYSSEHKMYTLSSKCLSQYTCVYRTLHSVSCWYIGHCIQSLVGI